MKKSGFWSEFGYSACESRENSFNFLLIAVKYTTFEMVADLSAAAEHGSNGEKSETGEVINFESVRAGLKF